MKTSLPAVVSTLFVAVTFSFGQGSLTPPGPPSPTMRTLTEVEPRTPLKEGSPGVTVDGNGGFTINQPGSYYMVGNVTVAGGNGINIAASGVTLDLRGFTISSTANPPAGTGIQMADPANQGLRNISVSGGHITGAITRTCDVYSGSGFNTGIARPAVVPRGVRITDISVVGVSSSGIALGFSDIGGGGSVVDRCTVELAGGTGITARTVVNSTATLCGSGIVASAVANSRAVSCVPGGITAESATNCTATGNGKDGITADTVSGCTAAGNEGIGIRGDSIEINVSSLIGGTVSGSTARRNRGPGIRARVVTDCTAIGNISHGIHVTGVAKGNDASRNGNGGEGFPAAGIYFDTDGVRIEANNCFDNDWGIQGAANTDSLIVRNSCRSNGQAPVNGGGSGDYDFPSTNTFGPIIQISGSLDANAAASHPWANFRY